jgi:hypothetical protein
MRGWRQQQWMCTQWTSTRDGTGGYLGPVECCAVGTATQVRLALTTTLGPRFARARLGEEGGEDNGNYLLRALQVRA